MYSGAFAVECVSACVCVRVCLCLCVVGRSYGLGR